MSQYDTFNRILMSLHQATLSDAHWLDTSTLIDEVCGTMGNGLVVAEPDGEIARVLFAGFYSRGQRREDLEHVYFDVYYPWDERIPRIMQLPDSQLAHVSELYTAEELRTSRTYNEGLPRMHGQNGLNVRLDGPDGSSIFWIFADPVGPGGWGSAQLAMVENLLPHIRQFVSVRQMVAGVGALEASLAELLDNTRLGVIHLDRSGRIVEANGRARRLLQRGDGIFDRGGFLHARLPADDERLERVLGRALPTFSDRVATSGSTTVRRPPGVPSLVLHVNPVTAAREMDFGLRNVAAMVLVVDPRSQPKVNAELVAKALGLTPSEGQVAAMLAQGKTVHDLALETGRQKEAVYWLLQQIYKKLGISRQVDLVRLVLSMSELSRSRRLTQDS